VARFGLFAVLWTLLAAFEVAFSVQN